MSKHTTWGVGGPAEWFVEVDTILKLKMFLRFAKVNKIQVFLMGSGSNLLVPDEGVEGAVVRLRGDFENIHFRDNEVKAGAGVFLPKLVKACAEKGLTGCESLVGIPGTVGGALIMNAGGKELEIGQIVKCVVVVNPEGEMETLPVNKINFMYRSSSLNGNIICQVFFELEHGDKDDIMKKIQNFLSLRLQTQPMGTLNAGSVFRNPEGYYAAELIENAGFKGVQVGKAQVSPKHANFIINRGGATAKDILTLISDIQKKVKAKFGVKLETEFKILGR